ncbi:MAG: aminotransferase class V-fold PLP-dependent enzyme [Methanobrevibacter sp.]|nr:aminotransferase class V-fold PLP-dependent enzyme [Methanobrevibacter sp.]
MKTKTVYLDGASNTPLSPKAYAAMKPFISKLYVGNSMSTHSYGVTSFEAVEKARKEMSHVLGIKPEELFFTSGATESNNWAIRSSTMAWRKEHPEGGHIICSALEHDSVIRCCEQMQDLYGIDISFVTPNPGLFVYRHGSLVSSDLLPLIRPDTFLICAMDINNELGIHNDIQGITELANKLDIDTLIDCTQSFSLGGTRVAIGKSYPKATFLSFSAHKFYGPTGVGGLICRKKLLPLIIGGAQEQGCRGGTTNVAGIIGMCAALKEVGETDYSDHYGDLSRHLIQRTQELSGIRYNSWGGNSIVSLNCSDILNMDHLASALDSYGIAVSAGSACDSTHDETAGEFNGSHVLKAIGLTEKEIRNTIRISYTRYNTTKDIDRLITALKDLVALQKGDKI